MCNCDRASELLSAQLDGELSTAERVELEAHLAFCEECRAVAAELASIHGVMPALLEEVPEGFHQRLMNKLEAEKVISFPVKKRHTAWKSWASLAAVFAVILLGGNALVRFGMMSTAHMPSPAAATGYVSGANDSMPDSQSYNDRSGAVDAEDGGSIVVAPKSVPEGQAAPQTEKSALPDAASTPRPTPDGGDSGNAMPRTFAVYNMALVPEEAGAIAAEAEYPGAEVASLADADGNYSGWTATSADGVTVEVSYLGLSPNGAYFEFSPADQDTGEACNRFAVKTDGSAVENLNKLGQEAYDALIGAGE